MLFSKSILLCRAQQLYSSQLGHPVDLAIAILWSDIHCFSDRDMATVVLNGDATRKLIVMQVRFLKSWSAAVCVSSTVVVEMKMES